jgi:hypothetical protein
VEHDYSKSTLGARPRIGESKPLSNLAYRNSCFICNKYHIAAGTGTVTETETRASVIETETETGTSLTETDTETASKRVKIVLPFS